MAAKIAGVFDNSLQEKILKSKIFVVGAGGIGCEILKNLVMSGFSDIDIIDLDTIDVSNLNRQFLFHKEHVGKSKAEIARISALNFNPDVTINAFHDSIFNTDYGVTFFQKYSMVLNALDNPAARNHVNRMCLTARIPLIESGTSGYDGQVELIKKDLTQCYECTPKTAQKSYPGCTIRNTPSEPIHCIVWAKHLFNQLFGEYDADEDVSPDIADPENAAKAGSTALDTEANDKGNVERVSTRKWAQSNDYDPEKIFNKLFNDDIQYLVSMSNLWKTRIAPTPINWDKYPDEETTNSTTEQNLNDYQKIWSISECAKVWAESITGIKNEFNKLADGDNLVWDKDDKYAMNFVAACANIRSSIFGIERKSRFEIKSMAGNIIPAIATTNAITAGISVMHAFRVLEEQYEKCNSVYVRLRLNPRNRFIVPDAMLIPPNPKCIVCSPKPEIVLKIDTSKITVKEFRDQVLIKTLNMIDPDVIVEGKGIILISSEEGETECNNDKILKDLSIVDGSILNVDDFFQNYNLVITIIHRNMERNDASVFEVIADPSLLKTKDKSNDADGEATKESQKSNENVEKQDNGKSTDAVASTSGQNKNDNSGEDGVSPMKILKLTDNSTEIEDDDDDMCIIENDDDNNESKNGSGGGGPSSSGMSTDQATSSSSSSIKSPPKKRKTETDGPSSSSAKRCKIDENDDDDLVIIEDD